MKWPARPVMPACATTPLSKPPPSRAAQTSTPAAANETPLTRRLRSVHYKRRYFAFYFTGGGGSAPVFKNRQTSCRLFCARLTAKRRSAATVRRRRMAKTASAAAGVNACAPAAANLNGGMRAAVRIMKQKCADGGNLRTCPPATAFPANALTPARPCGPTDFGG